MFWRRSTGHGAFAGLWAGFLGAAFTHGMTIAEGKGGWMGTVIHQFPSSMAQNFWIATSAFVACVVVTVIVSLATQPKTVNELEGLVYGITPIPHEEDRPFLQRPATIAIIVGVICFILNFIFR
jgi:SSS family solute:Na+ symporter